MQVNKAELLKICNLVKPGIAKKDVIEQATHYIFSGEDIATFNDKICIIHPFKSEIVFSTKANEFYKIVENIEELNFDLSLDGDNVKIKSKGTSAKRSTVVGDTAMVTQLIANLKDCMIGKGFWKKLPKDFTDGIYLTSFSASRDLTSGITTCCAIRGDAIYTTDNIRVSTYIMDSSMDNILLPAKDAAELVKYKVTEYGVSENWAHFRTEDGVIFSCKIMKGDYPFADLDGLFSEDEPILSFPSELKEKVAAISSLAEGESETDKSISVVVEKGRITVKAEQERGYVTKTIESDYTGDKFEFLINPIFFGQVLRHAVSFSLNSSKGQFQSDNFYHILSLPIGE